MAVEYAARAVRWSAFALLLLPLAARSETASAPAELSGRWILNEEVSDDLRAKMSEKRGGGGERNGRGGGGMGGGRGGAMGGMGGGMGGGRAGGLGGGPPGGQAGGGKAPDREAMRERMEALEAGISELQVSLDGADLLVVGANGEQQRFVIDGKERATRTLAGEEALAKAKWKRDSLIVKWENEQGKVKERYAMGARGEQLYVTVEVDGEGPMAGLELRRVYDRGVSKSEMKY